MNIVQNSFMHELTHQIKTQALKKGNFLLSSGMESKYYLDMKMITLYAPSRRYVTARIIKELECSDIEVLGAIGVGGLSMTAAVQGYSTVLIRQNIKEHGTKKKIEGHAYPGMRMLLVDDVVSTGKSIVNATQLVRDAGGIIEKVFVIIDREEGGEELIKETGVNFSSLFKISDIMNA